MKDVTNPLQHFEYSKTEPLTHGEFQLDPTLVTFDFFYVKHAPAVSRFIARRVSFEKDDILNEVFLIAWRKYNKIPSEPNAQLLWLFGTARRVIANKVRMKKRLAAFTRSSEQMLKSSQNWTAQSDESVAVYEALRAIPENHREVLTFIEWDGLSIRDTAEILEIPETTVTKRLYAARHTFAAEYKKLNPSA